ncbi:hypothetical protein ACTMTF_47500 [Nonomuraea sp. ZG12]|uniref:hypothetical protein n=1 Tax=Nonomuraea sp. ZG12 TaxID=3452207 RepID=UPI003F8A231E
MTEFEGQPARRPLTYEEVQALFDAADGRVEDKRERGRKGALTAMRDSATAEGVLRSPFWYCRPVDTVKFGLFARM